MPVAQAIRAGLCACVSEVPASAPKRKPENIISTYQHCEGGERRAEGAARQRVLSISARQRALAAKERGVYKGKKQNLDYDKVIEIKKSGMGASAITRELGCLRTMVYHVLRSA